MNNILMSSLKIKKKQSKTTKKFTHSLTSIYRKKLTYLTEKGHGVLLFGFISLDFHVYSLVSSSQLVCGCPFTVKIRTERKQQSTLYYMVGDKMFSTPHLNTGQNSNSLVFKLDQKFLIISKFFILQNNWTHDFSL